MYVLDQVKLKDLQSTIRKKDCVIAELRRQLSVFDTQQQATSSSGDAATAADVSAAADAADSAAAGSAMAESVIVTDSSSVKAMEDELSQKDDVIKELQSKLDMYQMSASSRDAVISDKVSVRRYLFISFHIYISNILP